MNRIQSTSRRSRHTVGLCLTLLASLLVVVGGCRGQRPEDGPSLTLERERPLMVELLEWHDLFHSPLFNPTKADPSDDAGDYSFVRQMVPVLFGRKVRGYDELSVLVDILRESGGDRAEFMTVLLRNDSPYFVEYAEHWSDYLVHALRIQRDGDKGMGSCFADSSPARVVFGSSNATQIASCVRTGDATTDCSDGNNFNMWDVVRSSVALDNLAPAYRGYLFAMQNFTTSGAEVTPHNEQDEVSESFHHIYLGRNQDCLGCHNTASSVSGEFDINGNPSYWNRHAPIPGNFELAVYGTPSGRENQREINQLFRSNITHGTAERPFGMSSCGTFSAAGSADIDSKYPPGYAPPQPYFTAALDPTASIWEVEDKLKSGYVKLASYGLRRDQLVAPISTSVEECSDHCANLSSPPGIPTPSAQMNTLVASNCATCHGSGHVSGIDLTGNWAVELVSQPAVGAYCTDYNYLVVPGDAASSCVQKLVDDDLMPSWGLSDSEKTLFRNWINGLPEGAGCSANQPSICETPVANDNDAGFAYLVATNIVDQVWQEVMGSRLNIPNYFPRNTDQRDILQNLVESVFVPRNWSLKSLLIAMLASEHFNRMAPADTAQNSGYMLAPYLKPFEVNDPRRPPEAQDGWEPGNPAPQPNLAHTLTHMNNEAGRSRHLNAVSDGIHRYSAEGLLNSIHGALDWPATKVGRSTSTYPNDSLRKGIGQFYSDVEPGFNGVSFQSLIRWEAQLGRCDKPTGDTDWIDRVVDAVGSAPGAYTRRDLAITLRDWLLGNGELSSEVPVDQTASEAALLNVLFGGTSSNNVLDASIGPGNIGGLAQQLRDYCGVLVETPQFMLAGIADRELGPKPNLRVCNEEPCAYRSICDSLKPAVERGLRANLACSDECVVIERERRLDPTIPICPRGRCERIPWDVFDPRDPLCERNPDLCIGPDPLCELNPQFCRGPEPPQCDLGCAVIDCCGGPLPPLEGALDYFLGLAEGGLIQEVEGVQIVRYGTTTPQPLEPETKLGYGDWLVMPPGSQLQIATANGLFQTPRGGVPRDAKQGWRFLVTAQRAPQAERFQRIGMPVQQDWIKQALTPQWERDKGAQHRVEFLMGEEDPRRIEQRAKGNAQMEQIRGEDY